MLASTVPQDVLGAIPELDPRRRHGATILLPSQESASRVPIIPLFGIILATCAYGHITNRFHI